MYKFTEEQRIKILAKIEEHHDGLDDLYGCILNAGYRHSVAQGMDYNFIDIFTKGTQDILFMLMAPTVSAEHGHFSITIMDHVGLPVKYYGHSPQDLLDQIEGQI
jgi:hypothetical protein